MTKHLKQYFVALSRLLWGKRFWKRGDFCRTVGSVTADVVKFYVEHCQAKHWEVS